MNNLIEKQNKELNKLIEKIVAVNKKTDSLKDFAMKSQKKSLDKSVFDADMYKLLLSYDTSSQVCFHRLLFVNDIKDLNEEKRSVFFESNSNVLKGRLKQVNDYFDGAMSTLNINKDDKETKNKPVENDLSRFSLF